MKGRRLVWGGALAGALLIAGLLAPWASPLPDGLDTVARQLGLREQHGARPLVRAPLSDYKIPGIPHARSGTAAAGIVGTLAVFGLAAGAGKLLARQKRPL